MADEYSLKFRMLVEDVVDRVVTQRTLNLDDIYIVNRTNLQDIAKPREIVKEAVDFVVTTTESGQLCNLISVLNSSPITKV